MPLLVSPIDGTTPMQQIRRDGIEIDRCPVSGGVWLDKGELEKLLAAVQQAALEDRQEYASYRQGQPLGYNAAPSQQQGRHYKDEDDYDRHHEAKYGKKSRMRSLFELFD